MDMTIGIKYCGGCNPRYNRRKLYDALVEQTKGRYDVQISEEDQTYDYLVVLAGCTAACMDISRLHYRKGKVIVMEDTSIEELLGKLKDL